MGRRYTKEEKISAVQLYEKLGHVTWVMKELEYTKARTMLYTRINGHRKGGLEELSERKSKYSPEQRKAAVEYYLANGMNVTRTITALGYTGKTVMQE